MGTLSLDELKQEVRAAMGNRTDLDSRLTRLLNLSQQRLARIHDFDEMEVISVSTLPFTGAHTDKYITFPRLRELYSFKVIDGTRSHRLKQVPQRTWNRTVPAPQELTRAEFPTHYTIWNNTAVIWPLVNRADVVIEAWHTVWPTPFTESDPTKKSDFNEKDEILIHMSVVYAFNSLGKQEEAQKHWKHLLPLLQEALNTDQTKPDLDIGPTPEEGETFPTDPWNDPFVKSTGNME